MPAASSQRLAELLTGHSAALTHKTLTAGHNLTQDDLTIAAKWLEDLNGSARQ
jgi:phospholipase/carboxylesterase